MNAERWQRLRQVFDAAIEADEETRAEIVSSMCAGDADMAKEVLQLLSVARTPRAFVDVPAASLFGSRLRDGMVLCQRFELLRPLGQGGMGDVWLANDRQLGETVAVKTIAEDRLGDPTSLARFKREIQLARRIAHRGVCRVYDLFEDDSVTPPRAFLTMEYIEGQSLAARLKDGPIPRDEALALFRQIAAGLGAAHDAGVVHRDLKPANIMLTATGGERRAVVMDFGLARAPAAEEQGGQTVTGALLGTPAYMAPEQIAGGTATPATDVYALGLLLFEMLSGTRPYASGTTLESWMRRARERPQKLSGVVAGVQRRVDEVIARCVEYDMRRRYQNAADVWAALESPWPTMAARGRRPAVVAVGVAAAATVIAAAVTLGSRWLPASAPPADALKWYDDAQQALAEGASVRALKGIQQAIDLAPAVPLFHATLSEIDLELDMPARAQEAMLRADTLAAASRRLATADAAYIRGIQQLLLRNCDSAIEALKTAAANSGERQPYRLISASRAMERCNRPDEAMTTLADAARLDPRNAAVPLRTARVTANRRNYPRALASLDAAETLFRDRNNVEGVGEVLALRGTFEAEQDQLDRAGSTLAKAADIATSLDDVRQRIRVLVQQGIVQRKRGDVAAAEQLTAAATTLARNNNLETLTLEGLFSSGNVHLARNQFREAESLFERARSIAEAQQHDEYRARAQLSLASVFVQTMRPDLAAESIKAARPYYERIKQTRILASADILTGQVLMMQANYPAAIALFESEINRAKQSADSEQEALGRQNLAGALATAGRYPDALAQYRQVLEAFRRASRPRNRILARLNVADILSRLGRFEEAEATLREMPQESPLAPELAAQAFRIAGSIAFRRGRDRDALEASRKVLALNANRSEWRTLSATLLRCSSASRLELHREADSSCRDALKITADNTGHLSMWIEARVTVAEASGSSAPFDSGATILRDLQPAIARVPETELRWRYLALLARAHPAEAEKAALTRELDALRLQWGDAPYRAWRHRPDVMRLLKGFSASNKETD